MRSQPRTGQWESGYFGWWYSYSDGTYAANETPSSTADLPLRRERYLKMGWVYDGGHWYFHGSSGPAAWLDHDRGSWYYLDPATGQMATG